MNIGYAILFTADLPAPARTLPDGNVFRVANR